MININATVRWKGYNPNDLKSTSGKRVWANCDVCGVGRWIEYRHNSPVCRSCALTGLKRSDESKRKMSVARTGIKLSDEHKQNIHKGAEKTRRQNMPKEYVCSECGKHISRGVISGKCGSCSRRGNPLSQAHKDAISRGNLGKVMTDTHKRNLSDSKKGTQIGVNNPMYGRNHTEESKQKMSRTRMSKPDAGRKKIKQIYSYLDYDRETNNEVVWRQKIDHNGKPQGIGCFLMRHPGSGSVEDRQRWAVESNATCRGLGSRRISLEHEGCQWHHVTRDCIVAMPAHIHSKISHKLGENKLEGVIG